MKDAVLNHIITANGGNFKAEEFLDYRDNLNREIIEEIVQFRNWCGYSIQITSAYRETGSHYTGKCIDCLLWSDWKQKQPSTKEIWLLANTWGFRGIGIYFDWNQGVGLHLDVIQDERQRPLRWIRDNGKYYYQSTKDGLFYHGAYDVKDIEDYFQSNA